VTNPDPARPVRTEPADPTEGHTDELPDDPSVYADPEEFPPAEDAPEPG
jgi:hypothetical protein